MPKIFAGQKRPARTPALSPLCAPALRCASGRRAAFALHRIGLLAFALPHSAAVLFLFLCRPQKCPGLGEEIAAQLIPVAVPAAGEWARASGTILSRNLNMR